MTPEQLKASILQMAIQGKLVEQRAEEKSADDLYNQIQASKKEKNIKGKIYPEIKADEIPFDIPDSWKWVRVAEICSILNGDRGKNYPAKSTLKSEGIPFISALNLDGKTVKQDDSLLCLSDDQYNKLGNGKLIKGDIVVCIRGSLGKHGRYPFDKGAIASSLVICRPFSDEDILEDYFMMYLDAPLFYSLIKDYDNGTAQPNLAAKSFEQFLFPLPPLAEQHRIVAKIEELLLLVNRYAEAYEKLEQFNAKFPEDMKKSILQYAIQGKLVEQRPEEGTAEELYKEIQEEKAWLVKEGKIKKEKSLAEITEDEIPFDIPESWKWVRIGSIVSKLTDGSHNPPPNSGSGYPVISAKNVKNGEITFENVDRYTDEDGFIKENPRTNISRNDVIMGIIGGSIGNVGVYNHDIKVIAQRSIAIMTPLIETSYFTVLLQSQRLQACMRASTAGSAQGGVYLGTIRDMVVPIPPMKEQKRIVSRIKEILPICERLVK